jgi:hypothetical protein
MPLIAGLGHSKQQANHLLEALPGDPIAGANRFSMGWFNSDSLAASYNSPTAPELDLNLNHLTSQIWLLTTNRRGEEGDLSPVLAIGEWLWCGISRLPGSARLRSGLLHQLDTSTIDTLTGLGLSTLLCACFRQLLDRDQEMTVEEAIDNTFDLLQRLAGESPPDLATIISDGQRLLAVRTGDGQDTPPLYYCSDFGSIGEPLLIASEPLGNGIWHPLPGDHRITLSRDEPPELSPLV